MTVFSNRRGAFAQPVTGSASRALPFGRALRHVSIIALAALPIGAGAQDAAGPHHDSPRQSLTAALTAFGRQSGLQVSAASEVLRGRTASPVSNAATPAEALDQMLRGTGLGYRVDERAITVIMLDDTATQAGTDPLDDNGFDLGTLILTADALSDRTSYTAQDIIEGYGGNINQALRNTPGTFTRTQRTIPSTVVNIRGMQSRGRVASLIDGVPQTFSNMSGYTGTLESQTYIDPLMLSGVNVVRGPISGQHGVGTLSGGANFQTLRADDILLPGRDSGGLFRSTLSSNGRGAAGMLAFAQRETSESGGQASGVVALSRSMHAPYHDGHGKTIQDYLGDGDIVNLRDSDFDTGVGSALIALEWQPAPDHRFTIAGTYYESDFLDLQNSRYFWDITNRTARLTYDHDPDNPLVDLSFDIWSNTTEVHYDPDRPVVGASTLFAGRRNRSATHGFSLSNRSEVTLGSGDVVLDFGGSWRSDDYKGLNKDVAFGMNGQGELTVAGLFADGVYSTGRFEVSGGLNWMHYTLEGLSERQPCATGYCDTFTDRSGSAWSGNIKLAYNISENSQVYGGYAHTTRPPTIAEMFMPNILTAFTPVPQSTSHNLDLLPETGRTFEIGGRRNFHDLVTARDTLTLEANLFHSTIDNFIGYGINLPDLPGQPTYADYMAINTAMTQWRNASDPVTMQGLELSARYDSDLWYGRVTATISNTDQPVSATVGIVSDDNALPGRVATLDLGRRFMAGALTVGGRVHHVSDVTIKETNTNGNAFPPSATVHKGAGYNLLDLYASYSPSDAFTTYIQIENVADDFYLPVNAGQIGLGNTGGRGRNVTVGLNVRF